MINNIEIQGNPTFINCVKELDNIFNFQFYEKTIKNKKRMVGDNGQGVYIILIPEGEKGNGRINMDVNCVRLCEINTYPKEYRIAAHEFPSYVDAEKHKQHYSAKFSKEKFFPFIVRWINEITGIEKYGF